MQLCTSQSYTTTATAATPTVNLPGHRLVIKDKCEDSSVVQLGHRHTSLLKQLGGQQKEMSM
jgi:hypothetical protein